MSPITDMGQPKAESRQQHWTTLAPVMGSPLGMQQRRSAIRLDRKSAEARHTITLASGLPLVNKFYIIRLSY